MAAVIAVGLAAIALPALLAAKHPTAGLRLSMLLLCLLLGLRYDLGPDYKTYAAAFERSGTVADAFEGSELSRFETGWRILNAMAKPIGFFGLVGLLAAVSLTAHYLLIKDLVPASYYWVAIALYVFTPSMLLIQASAMRQSVAISLFLYALPYLARGKLKAYSACVIVASSLHYSALVTLPLALLAHPAWRSNTLALLAAAAAYVCLLAVPEITATITARALESYFERYDLYTEPGVVRSGLGFAYTFAILLLLLHSERKLPPSHRSLVRVAIAGCLLAPFGIVLDVAARLGLYFSPAIAVACLAAVSRMRSPWLRIGAVLAMCVFALLQFYQFYYLETWTTQFDPYKTIFSADGWR